jgi:hypothetical protein
MAPELKASGASAARRSPVGPRDAFFGVVDGGLEASINATVLGF